MKKRLFLTLLSITFLIAACEQTPTRQPTPTVDDAMGTAVPTNPAEPASTNTPSATATTDPFKTGTNGFPWWNDLVFYEIFVRSFNDSDGDGIGDINGIIEKLDYLNDGDPSTTDDLGITGIWLMPITVSPSYHGYDVVDYFQVDPDYGTNEDFIRLMEEAHARGIRVIVDLVMNHTSTQHPWFIESQNPDSDMRDWYIWADENPNYRGPGGQVVWHSNPSGFYYALFWGGMPDLNYENPNVTFAMFEAAKFWLEEMNVDGFRLDAIKHMVEEGEGQENTRSTHDWLQEFNRFYKTVNPDALAVGEAWTSTQQVLAYTGDEVDIAFQFDLAQDLLKSSDTGLDFIFSITQQEVYDAFPANQYATFISNHDQNRVMSQLDEDEGKARVAAALLLTGPGVPFIYYGEEIGMTGTKPDEDIRRPMQWASNGPKVGFTTGTPWRPAAADFPVRSVELQDSEPDSLLNLYRDLIHLRNTHEALRVGEWTLLDAGSNRLYTFIRQTENETVLVVINLNKNPVMADEYGLDLGLDGAVTAVSLYGLTPSTNPTGDGYVPFDEIPPQSVHIIQLVPEG